MKTTYFFLLISFIASAEIYSQNIFENDSIILWNKNKKLKWSDFKKTKDDNLRTSNNYKALANTNLNISLYPSYINCDDLDKVIVFTKFGKYESWKYKNLDKGKFINYNKKDLLNHEQVHFDISEIYVRKIRHLIKSMANDCDFEIFKKKYYKFLKESAITQTEYDQETKHGLDTIMQKKWNKKVDSLLCEYKDYEMNITLDDIGL